MRSMVLYTKNLLWGKVMVEFVKISENGMLLQIKEVSDLYRDRLYQWDEDE